MLHELLLALGGYPGSIFVRKANSEVKVIEELPFVHPTETALLNRLCKLAAHYTNFVDFSRRYGYSAATKDGGLYLNALCQGLDKVLSPYRQTLVKLEEELLQDPHLTTAYVQSVLEPYQLLFPALWNVLEQIQQQKMKGCYVLDLLYKSCGCGIPTVTAALKTLLHHCHQVLYKQLASWMLHGNLLDPYGEFFVHRAAIAVESQPEPVEEDDLGLMGVTGRQFQQALKLQSSLPEPTIVKQFSLRADMLPSYIPLHIAEKILFVGESVQMFECDKAGRKKHQSSIFKKKTDDFAKKLHDLSTQQDFYLMNFEEVIDEIRHFVAEQLWQLVMKEGDLVKQLRSMKDFYLLGRGELFLTFIDQAQILLQSTPTGTTQYDVNMAFQQSARQVLLEDDSLMQMFSFALSDTGSPHSHDGTVETGWQALNLQCTVQWPLHILFHQTTLDRYNTLFGFLLYVKRTQLALQSVWALNMRRRHQKANLLTQHQWLRNHMAFLVDNLQYYLQVDVIESQFTLLLDKIDAQHDFENVRLAHENFVTSLLAQSLLLMRPVERCLIEILGLCHRFCRLVEGEHFEQLADERDEERLSEVAKGFKRQTSLLLQMLSSVRNHQASPHLAQLLLRIDYNKYFTLSGEILPATSSLTSNIG